ncbi:PREDICTED: LOW QUALITY PROTEIN: zinc finger protein 883-like, partial [Apaloderma vittatum]|uniref:LOW QUALITY PROTEIN: zinc finger protein 883-like n=1 Tax=Apaloderma vittatum TaxID=57397 RepID=UPI0005211D74
YAQTNAQLQRDSPRLWCLQEVFSVKSSLTRHQRIRASEKSFKCTERGQSFTESTVLLQHWKTHIEEEPFLCTTPEKPFACPRCDKTFSQRYHIKRHLKALHKEDPYVVRETFCWTNSVTHHQIIHTGERPCTCPYCKKTFNNISTLVRHQRTHQSKRPYKCPKCGERFSRESSFQ